jgi:quinolinate synthase
MACMCATMYRIDRPHLAWRLDNLARNTPVNRIKVDRETTDRAHRGLERVLDVQ